MWEHRLGISTRGVTDVLLPGYRYTTLSYSLIFRILRSLSLLPDDVLIDIGCGKGRVVCCAATFRVRQVIGIDHSSELCRDARRNVERMRAKQSPAMILEASAETFDYRPGTVLYFYNSFGPPILDRMLARLKSAVDETQRPIRFVYARAEHDAVLRGCGWLQQYDYWDDDRFRSSGRRNVSHGSLSSTRGVNQM
ncbi:MAG: SAM-dependent methyltransferase [Candidatus Rokuibacteriota bacterium]|nr:MAG: SAM-dependent methyltransferase [Candidatus Rokubacteria bacterium]